MHSPPFGQELGAAQLPAPVHVTSHAHALRQSTWPQLPAPVHATLQRPSPHSTD
jgi:hypothetical protein